MTHLELVKKALYFASEALASAERNGRRADCLRAAVGSLSGAVTNVLAEDTKKQGTDAPASASVCGKMRFGFAGNEACGGDPGHAGDCDFVEHDCRDCGTQHGTCRHCGTTHGDAHSDVCPHGTPGVTAR